MYHDAPISLMVQSLMATNALPPELAENEVRIRNYIVRLLSNYCTSIRMDYDMESPGVPCYTIDLIIPVLYNTEVGMPESCPEEPLISIPEDVSLNRFSGVQIDERDDI